MSTEYPIGASVLPAAHALRPVRFKGNVAIHYTGTTFPQGAYKGCELFIRRMECFGHIAPERGDLQVDVLDKIGVIIQEFPVTRRGFEYMRQKLRFVLEAA